MRAVMDTIADKAFHISIQKSPIDCFEIPTIFPWCVPLKFVCNSNFISLDVFSPLLPVLLSVMNWGRSVVVSRLANDFQEHGLELLEVDFAVSIGVDFFHNFLPDSVRSIGPLPQDLGDL